MAPSSMTAIRSATSMASSWSWVTRTVVWWTSSCRRRSQIAQLLAHPGVERAEGLVEQEHLGLDGEGPGEGHALALPARELARVAVGQPVELHQRESSSTRSRVSPLGRLRMRRPKATFSRTVMCLKAA